MDSHIHLVKYCDVQCGFGSHSVGQGLFSLLRLKAQILPKTSEPLALYNKSYDYTSIVVQVLPKPLDSRLSAEHAMGQDAFRPLSSVLGLHFASCCHTYKYEYATSGWAEDETIAKLYANIAANLRLPPRQSERCIRTTCSSAIADY
jgi:hypothetical protein